MTLTLNRATGITKNKNNNNNFLCVLSYFYSFDYAMNVMIKDISISKTVITIAFNFVMGVINNGTMPL